METETNKNLIDKLDVELSKYREAGQIILPKGWINKIRTTIGMSQRQLGDRITVPVENNVGTILDYKRKSISIQGISELESGEADGNISLNSLTKIARAFDMKLVYGFVPIGDTLYSMVEKRAKEVATEFYKKDENAIDLKYLDSFEQSLPIAHEKAVIKAKEDAVNKKANEIIEKRLKTLWD